MQRHTNYIIKQIEINKYNVKLFFVLPIKKFTLNLLKMLWNIQFILGYTLINALSLCVYLQKIQYKLKKFVFLNLKNKFKNNINFKKLYAINSIEPNIFILFSNIFGLTFYSVTQKNGGLLLI
jgi:hypothetical protein